MTDTALLVMDVQPAILARLDDAGALLERTAAAIASARRHGAQVAYVRVGFDAADRAALPPGSPMAQRLGGRPDALPADAPETQIHAAVAPEPDDIVVRKTRVGPFLTTDLDARLRDRGVDRLALAGVSTSGVVLSTVRDAADRDYRLLVLADACADPRPDVGALLLQSVFPSQAEVIGVAQLDDRLTAVP